MNVERDSKVQMIPLARIEVVNPRERGRKKFRQIVENIAHLGLKRPITVTPKRPDHPDGEYYLVCGNGPGNTAWYAAGAAHSSPNLVCP
jgi:ParB family chromosome partitioning protein